MTPPRLPLRVAPYILAGDAEVHCDAHALLTDDALVIAQPPTRIELPLTAISGMVLHGDDLTVHLTDGRTVTLGEQPELRAFAQRLESAICTFPELLVSLRSFARERSAAGSDHDRWFEGLLHARKLAQESRTLDTQRRAFDAARLQRAASTAREHWARERYPEAGPHQRALIAELEDCSAEYQEALVALESAAAAVQQAPDTTRFVAWRAWLATLVRAFEAADTGWTALIPVLCDSRGREGRFWRRLLKRGSRVIADEPAPETPAS
jgi:hypothetical protein